MTTSWGALRIAFDYSGRVMKKERLRTRHKRRPPNMLSRDKQDSRTERGARSPAMHPAMSGGKDFRLHIKSQSVIRCGVEDAWGCMLDNVGAQGR
jgi:hypothetical protein